jgi:glycine oxidase
MGSGGKVTVAGAGALGLSAALALADAGWAVTVCASKAREPASAVAAGMLAPVFEAALEDGGEAALDLLIAARNAWPALAARAGVQLDRAGAAAVGEDAWLGEVAERLVRVGVRPTELGRATLEALAPEPLAPDLARGLLVREDWRLDARPALAALRRAAEAAGVQFRDEALTGRPDGDMLVIATGADRGLADLAPELGQLSPIRGQIIGFMNVRRGGISLRSPGAYAVPGCDGMLVGATMEPGVDSAAVDPAALTPITQAAGRLFPGLAEATFGVSAGVRAATPDGLPMVGVSSAPGVVLAVGARRNGWLLAPLVAQIVTACATGRDPGPYAQRFDPRRFVLGEEGA